ncbi:DNA methyltransferase [Schizosaccharomyces cryophilus OY26]|uniref:tRNA (cytosine(38)-C(5))-methyltransferase n=1 Tax=Schizosaccharomyces cryophilus (strain OY26 / ATCC MYA-4695 / CBS 11777 / NBRC 106824 / NRRL Y48691) TaxID=653667 RepID=S9XEI2_SCHCR|nr:DNA methyltransferase [Schizosaccharomyces cryophilus OY26]EPY52201.1 DNA methyltransferase [Schizosaccharomyces cryophilus OY26]
MKELPKTSMKRRTQNIRVLELYSGIGGMHYALKSTNIPFEVVCAIDINPLANTVYNHNLGNRAKHIDITKVNASELDGYHCDLWTMSPSCQPYTRIGKQQDVQDPRSHAFLHLLEELPKVESPPKYILIENVQGFENSITAQKCREVLKGMNYNFIEGNLTPKQSNIPNSRCRWYGLARKGSLVNWNFEEIIATSFKNSYKGEGINTLESFLETQASFESYFLPEKLMFRYGHQLDIVKPTSTNCCCFTRGYGQLVQGSGSVLQTSDHESIADQFEKDRMSLRLRYFTAREIARIMGFPDSFQWKEIEISEKTMYRLLGNSINVNVVSRLLSHLLYPSTGGQEEESIIKPSFY